MSEGAKQAVVITGASTGIGEACVRLLVEKGFLVFGSVRTAADADRLKAQFGENYATPLLRCDRRRGGRARSRCGRGAASRQDAGGAGQQRRDGRAGAAAACADRGVAPPARGQCHRPDAGDAGLRALARRPRAAGRAAGPHRQYELGGGTDGRAPCWDPTAPRNSRSKPCPMRCAANWRSMGSPSS